MPPFVLTPHIRSLIDLAYAEDMSAGDPTSEALFEAGERALAKLIAKAPLVVCGLPLLPIVAHRVDPNLLFTTLVSEGASVEPGELLLTIEGEALSLLLAERTMLNFFQQLSGIATQTAKAVAIAGPTVRVVDTRKTLPGWRHLAKYAVRVGGGRNHRLDLGGGCMIKDNHIDVAGSITKAVRRVRERAPHTLKIEVEVRNHDEVREALEAGADILLLDNMGPKSMAEIVRKYGDRALMEASGGITLENLAQVAQTGVDLISLGTLTHSAHAVDISMKMELRSR